jgi:hypothetical protein
MCDGYLPHIIISSLVDFHCTVTVTALDTKQFALWTEVVDTRLAWSRAEFELPLSPADAP